MVIVEYRLKIRGEKLANHLSSDSSFEGEFFISFKEKIQCLG